jgi:hypothetical protein
MLDSGTIGAARHIAGLAAAARDARDRMLSRVAPRNLGEPPPEHGEGRPLEETGLAAVPPDEPTQLALREAIDGLPDEVRRGVWAVMRTGSGDYAGGDWPQAFADAAAMPDDAIIVELAEELELPERLAKGLYELGAADQPASR